LPNYRQKFCVLGKQPCIDFGNDTTYAHGYEN
jgi:hypothetical protein